MLEQFFLGLDGNDIAGGARPSEGTYCASLSASATQPPPIAL